MMLFKKRKNVDIAAYWKNTVYSGQAEARNAAIKGNYAALSVR